jgi:hypothetical protein
MTRQQARRLHCHPSLVQFLTSSRPAEQNNHSNPRNTQQTTTTTTMMKSGLVLLAAAKLAAAGDYSEPLACGWENEDKCLASAQVGDFKACIPTGDPVAGPYEGGICEKSVCTGDSVLVEGATFDDRLGNIEEDINGVYKRALDSTGLGYFEYQREVVTNTTGTPETAIVQLLMGQEQYGWSWQGSWIFQFQQGNAYFAMSDVKAADPTMAGTRYSALGGLGFNPASEVKVTCN